MIDIRLLRENPELIKENCKKRNVKIDIDLLLRLDIERRKLITEVESLRAEQNKKSKNKPTEEEIVKIRETKEKIKKDEEALREVEEKFYSLFKAIPNFTHPNSPIGGEDNYKTVFTKGKIPKFDFPAKDHEELMINLDLIDFERGVKVSGNKFYFSKNNLVRLNQALINYGLDVVSKHDYIIMETPDLAKDEILSGIGFNPRGPETQIYSIEKSDLSLIGTAEITIGGYHANEILDLSDGPKKYAALSHCFRTEAGTYGRLSKGLYRVHQFTKLEMFVFCKPEDSEKYHEEILSIEKEIVDGLKLPYRVIDAPSGDLGGPAYRRFDIESWMTMKGEKGKGDYGEITSCSNCTDYQARRLNIRYKKRDGSAEFVHTLNGTAVVLSRFPLAIIENYQQKDGTINVPTILQKYIKIKKIK
jgi:seryl-tRNA synthetase